jgi:heavy metal sensor kinase
MSLGKTLRLPNTLAFRLTLWYGGIFTLCSCVAFLLFYTLITSVLEERTDQELLAQAQRFSTLLAGGGIGAVNNGAVIEAQGAGEKKVFFRLLNITGEAFSSSNMSYWKDINVEAGAIEKLLRGSGPILETITIPNRSDEVRILYAMLSPTVIVQIGQAMESQARLLDAFKRIFIITMSLLVFLAAGVGWFMARRAVSGITAVTHTAQKISAGALQERVPVKPRGDEIDQLATTFNQMLDRIQTLLTEIKEMGDNIAHDLRSPVTRIRGTAEVTLTTGKSFEDYESMAASTIEDCDRLLDMINTMLLISKTEAGVEKPSSEKVEITALVRKACELFDAMAEDRNVSLNYDLAEKNFVNGDPRMLQRMLSNIVDNAVKYTPSGGKIEISLNGSEKHITISIKDTGVGMSGADQKRVFERFYRCDQSRSQPGTGLGLSLARAIARAHGGDITVASAVNQGSTFSISLPRAI